MNYLRIFQNLSIWYTTLKNRRDHVHVEIRIRTNSGNAYYYSVLKLYIILSAFQDADDQEFWYLEILARQNKPEEQSP
jgi:hypothetical protein